MIVPIVDFIWHLWKVFIPLFVVFLIVYSFLHLRIEVIFSGLVAIGTVMMGFFAWQQHKLERTNQKIAMYDKRLAIYNEIRRFINLCIDSTGSIKPVPIEEILRFVDNTNPAIFLFKYDKELTEYLFSLIEKVAVLKKIIIDLEQIKETENKRPYIYETTKIQLWFVAQNASLGKKFEPYLRIEE